MANVCVFITLYNATQTSFLWVLLKSSLKSFKSQYFLSFGPLEHIKGVAHASILLKLSKLILVFILGTKVRITPLVSSAIITYRSCYAADNPKCIIHA